MVRKVPRNAAVPVQQAVELTGVAPKKIGAARPWEAAVASMGMMARMAFLAVTVVVATVATAVAVASANSAAATVWRRLAAAAAGAESGCTAACTGCERRLFTWRGVRRRRVLVHRDVHWLVREISRD